ncbi:MAG TPA: TolC family protein [Terracidiphilus sp.]|nr:TolC family protein [Terracidiphilus sp.]
MRRVIDGVAACLVLAAASLAAPAQTPPAPTPQPPTQLTLADAERMAIQNNPNISIAHLVSLAQGQVTREARSAWMPTVTGDLTGVGAHDNTRITAGLLNNPSVYDRAAGGLTVSELITDFGRTHNLVLSAKSTAQAQLEDERATQEDVTLTVDQAFYQALTAQAVLKVMQQTVAERQATADQVGAMTKAKLRSQVDLSFAQVQLSQAQLMLLDAKNQAQTAMAALNTVLGFEQDKQYTLVDQTPPSPTPPPQNAEPLVQQAFTARPDLAAANDNFTAAKQYSKAERDLWMPTVSALAAAGGTPVRADQIQSSWYGAAGANVSIPIFNGFLFNAREQEAKLRASAAQQQVRNLRDVIARDVRTAVLNARDAFQRIGVSQEMLNQSNLALDLSQRRYNLGLSSIVELTQAQLAQTQAQIAVSNARYAYATSLSALNYQLGQ